MTAIANVELSNTFDTWRIRSNRAFVRLNNLATSESTLFSNTVNANVAFRSAGQSHMVGNVVFGSSLDANGNPLLLDTSANTRIQGVGTTKVKIQVGATEPLYIFGSNVSINETQNARTDGQNATLNVHQPSGQTNTVIIGSIAQNATLGPELALFRDNNTRAAMDNIGVLTYRGRSNANAAVDYAKIYASIEDHSNSMEDGIVTTQVMKAGSLTDMWKVDQQGVKLEQGLARFGANVYLGLTSSNTLSISANTAGGHTDLYVSSNGIGVGTATPATKFAIQAGHIRLDSSYGVQFASTNDRVTGGSNYVNTYTNNAVKQSIKKDQVAYSANVVPSADNTYSLGASGNEWAVGHFETVNGTLGTAAQPNITSVGTLTSLTVSGQMTFSSSVVFSQNATTTSGTVTLDFDSYQNHFLTLNGNIVLANPSTENVGQAGVIAFTQDGTGNRTLSLGTDWETVQGGGYTLSTAAGSTDIIPYYVVATNRILLGQIQKSLA